MDVQNRQKWLDYLAERDGTYEYRTLRYAAVYDKLEELGLERGDLIVDVGAGMCDFDRYIRTTRGFDGRYLPVDGSIDGTDLNLWTPSVAAEFYVCIETLEHLLAPERIASQMKRLSTKGVVVTTPCPEKQDIFEMDRTHVSPLSKRHFESWGWNVDEVMAFPHRGIPGDTLIASVQTGSERS